TRERRQTRIQPRLPLHRRGQERVRACVCRNRRPWNHLRRTGEVASSSLAGEAHFGITWQKKSEAQRASLVQVGVLRRRRPIITTKPTNRSESRAPRGWND